MEPKNPYAKKDGSPKSGQEGEWSQWIDETERTRRALLTDEQRAVEDATRRAIRHRMQAESDFR